MADTKVTVTDGGKDDRVVDDTAPGEGPVIVSATEARASEPVLTSEEALDKDAPPPTAEAHPAATGGSDHVTSGDGDYVARESARTGDAGEPEWNAVAHEPTANETTYDGHDYAEVANPSNPMERLEKRELELGADMDYGEHRRTYQMFMEATKYGSVVVVALLVAMAVGFFMSGGFVGGIVVFFGAILAGFVFFR